MSSVIGAFFILPSILLPQPGKIVQLHGRHHLLALAKIEQHMFTVILSLPIAKRRRAGYHFFQTQLYSHHTTKQEQNSWPPVKSKAVR